MEVFFDNLMKFPDCIFKILHSQHVLTSFKASRRQFSSLGGHCEVDLWTPKSHPLSGVCAKIEDISKIWRTWKCYGLTTQNFPHQVKLAFVWRLTVTGSERFVLKLCRQTQHETTQKPPLFLAVPSERDKHPQSNGSSKKIKNLTSWKITSALWLNVGTVCLHWRCENCLVHTRLFIHFCPRFLFFHLENVAHDSRQLKAVISRWAPDGCDINTVKYKYIIVKVIMEMRACGQSRCVVSL